MSITGLPGQGPVRVGIPVADLTAGIFAAMGVLIALLEREQSGEGQWVTSSLLGAQIAMLDFQAARWTIAHEVPGQAGNNHPTSIPTGVFATADGHINIAAAGNDIYRRCCKALGAPRTGDRSKVRHRQIAVGKPRHLNGADRGDHPRQDLRRMDRQVERRGCAVRADLQNERSVRRSAGETSGHRPQGAPQGARRGRG